MSSEKIFLFSEDIFAKRRNIPKPFFLSFLYVGVYVQTDNIVQNYVKKIGFL